MTFVAPARNLTFRLATGESLDVRRFRIDERLSAPFVVELFATSPDPDLDLETFAGAAGRFAIEGARAWVGVVRAVELVHAEPTGLSTYRLELVPALWLLTQRTNHRMFQRMTEPDMAVQVLSEWKLPVALRVDRASYKKRDYRVQYGESDFGFVSRMLEAAGITYWFETHDDVSVLVLADAPQSAAPRATLDHVDDPSAVPHRSFVTNLSIAREVRPGKLTVRDVDFRVPPDRALLATTMATATALEAQLETFQYEPGAFLFEGEAADTPHADTKLAVRTSEREAARLSQQRLDAERAKVRIYKFETNALDLGPGQLVPIVGHARAELGEHQPLLVTSSVTTGEVTGSWWMACRATRSDAPFRPELATPKPRATGVETATVVGAAGDEICTDEFGRVRVHFHWDRESRMTDDSSCWVPVSQPWAGTGYGGMNIPRVGQEVVVGFLGGDPDRPMVTGRVYTASQPVPYRLPQMKTQSGWRSNSTKATGGYNELMFEDDAGRELVRVQAERDMQTLVKHDETRKIENDRITDVLNDETITVGGNRTETVGINETITIGKNRTETVIGNEELTVQGDRTRTVNANEDVFIGANYSRQVVENVSETIGANASWLITANRNAQVGVADSTTVGVMRTASIGVSDATTVGNLYSVSCAPGGVMQGSVQMTPGRIELSTGQGASIVLEGSKITLHAEEIILEGTSVDVSATENAYVFGNRGLSVLSGAALLVQGQQLALVGSGTAELSSPGPTTVSGTPVQLNGPGLFAGRVTEAAPTNIMTGAALVLVGGASFPYPVERQADGSLRVGDHIVIQPGTEDPAFQSKVLRDLGIMSSTTSGAARLQNLQNNPSGHDITIREYSAAEAAQYGANNSLAYPDGDGGHLTYDANGNPVPGPGCATEIAYEPEIVLGPDGTPEPADAVLYHEMGHAEHNAYGVDRANDPMGGGWENGEEWQTIEGGVNEPGGSSIPGVPASPSENDYLGERGYPYVRTDHGSGYSFPDGTAI